jgi:hypothetical protein
MKRASLTFSILLVVPLIVCCEIDTKLKVTGGNPPVFQMSGNARLSSIRVRGHNTQRNVLGEDALIYWEIDNNRGDRTLGDLGSVIYGKIPDGYVQKYPETGAAPQLDEGQHYYVRVTTANANGDEGYFIILDGKVYYSRIASELPAEKPAVH